MNPNHFNQYADIIRVFNGDPQSPALRIASEGRLSVYYAPFEWVNPAAKIIIVGITPGPTQALNALAEAKRQLASGATVEATLMRAKQVGAFSGDLRTNLIAMLDRVGIPQWAGINGAVDLFGARSDLLHTASVLPYPVFVDGKPYNGSPSLLRSALLRSLTLEHFVPAARAIPSAQLLAVGDVPYETLNWLAKQGLIDPTRILGRLPHPSGASQERVNYFIGKKQAADLSPKTSAAKLDQMRWGIERALASSARSRGCSGINGSAE